MSSNSEISIDWIAKWAHYAPQSIALINEDDGRSFSYDELDKIERYYANRLNEFGLKKGDRVAVLSPNRIEFIFLFLAVQRLGLILVPINFRLAVPEVEYVIGNASPALWILGSDFKDYPERIQFKEKTLLFNEISAWTSQALEADYINSISFKAGFEDVCMILYTSGTTGKPKGAQFTHKMFFWNSVNTGLRLNLTQSDVSFIHAPFFHTGGWNVLTLPMLHRGATLIFISKFDADRLLNMCEKYQATILWGVPTMMDMLYRSEKFQQNDLSSLRYAVVGGEPMPIPLIEKWQDKNIPIRQGYGLTEFGPNVFSLNEEDAIRKRGSIGFANFYIDTKIVKDDGTEAQTNEAGELWLKGPVITPGYWNNPEATNQAIENGWFKTGDIVRCDEEGYFYVLDRKKDMFISGGENVYPAEVEMVIRQIPEIKETAVIGVPDEKWGEVGKAFLVLNNGTTENGFAEMVATHCRNNLAKFKVPKYFEVIDELPKSDSGKILKRALKK